MADIRHRAGIGAPPERVYEALAFLLPDEVTWILHIAFSVISTAALIYLTIKSFQPFPGSLTTS